MVLQTPPLGWNTWNTFGPNINEKLILEAADAMVAEGLADCGYKYIVIDDCWALRERDKDGHLVPDPEKFPHGMKYVADYVHGKGLKFGMYSCAGYMTCGGYPGSFDYEWIDAATFASWGVDYLKYDYCYHAVSVDPDAHYKRMGLALANCGRDIVFSACSWGADDTRQWIKETGAHLWRSTGDIFDNFRSIRDIAQSQLVAQEYNGQGCFNDMDMLVVGMSGAGNIANYDTTHVSGCTTEEYRLHFSLWALLNSPLMIGCDIRHMSPEAKAILTNKDVIAINQDPACRQPFFVTAWRYDKAEERHPGDPFFKIYPLECPTVAKFLDNGDVAIGMFNLSDPEDNCVYNTIRVTPDDLGLPLATGKTLELTDLWTGEKVYPRNGVISDKTVPAHSCLLYRAKVVDAQ